MAFPQISIESFLLDAGPWVLLVVGAATLGFLALTTLRIALGHVTAALEAFRAFLLHLVRSLALLAGAILLALLLFYGVYATYYHIRLF